MPELFTVLMKVNIALVLFCLGYYLVLRKLTFYTLNRAYLVTAILFSSVYPFIDLSAFAQRHQEIVAPVQNVVIIWQEPAQNFIKQAAYWNWLEIAFWAGAALFTLRLVFQLVSLYKIYRRSTEQEINGQAVRVVNGDISPFSFWQSIYINPDNLSAGDLHNIIEHEQVHVKEWHTLDVLLTEISVIFYWFNPGIWMMKKAVRENIEFITDRKILQKGLDSKAYQYSLLNITFNQPAPAITSNFNFSTLKKRIMMMNAKRSSNLNLTRYAFLMPVVVVCLFVFSLSKAETVKASPAFKAVAVAVENIKNIALNADTTPVKTTKTQPNPKVAAVTVTIDASLQNKEVQKQENVVGVLTSNNENTQLAIRGVTAKDSVIIIVDGKIVQNLNFVDPNTIETVSVFKDRGSWEYIKNATGIAIPADLKISGMILIKTRQSTNAAFNSLAGHNEVIVTGYGTIGAKPANEVVVTGYGTNGAKRANEVVVTGHGSNIAKFIDSVNKSNTVMMPRGLPANEKMPLVMVDGKELKIESRESLENSVDPNTIQSVNILKDASATQLYGEKGKNGVIIITTKKR